MTVEVSRRRSAAESLEAIAGQAGWLAAAKIVQGAASILATLAVARHLGPTQFGELSLAIAIASFVATAAALGLEHIASRELSAAPGHSHPSVLPILRRLRIAGALAGAVFILAISATPRMVPGTASLLLILCVLPLAQVGDVAEWQLVAAGRTRRIAFVSLAVSPAAALIRVWLALHDGSIAAFAWVLVVEWAARSSCLILSMRQWDSGSLPPAVSDFAQKSIALLRESMPLLLAGIAVFIYMRIDQFMIAAMLGPRQTGLYSAIVTLAETPLILPALLLRAALPALTRQPHEADRDHVLLVLMRSSFYLHLVVALLLAAIATPLVVLLYGDAYRPAAGAFQLQVLAAPFVSMGILSSAWLVLEKKTSHALRRTVIGAATNVLLNVLLIPAFGIQGAAAATLLAQFVATYAADAAYPSTRSLFRMKTLAMSPVGSYQR